MLAEVATETRNRLLRLLPEQEAQHLFAAADLVTVKTKDLVWESEGKITDVYFPEDAIISLVTQMKDGSGVEAMTIGNDGFAGLAVFHGLDSTQCLACGQITGKAWRLSAEKFRQVTAELPTLQRVLHQYSHLVFEIVSQSAACNRLHVIEQRCARWLLMSEDRVGRPKFDLTQEFLAEMLGVRRPGVTVAMGVLEKQGLIAHGRGNITVINRAGLEAASCECYAKIKRRQDELLS
ncbi:MAG TPA: Crp/Fnr family transcriptional regulator [Gemmatimonadaceae bacterium]|nr:Crp/Fnr family transcriptional regulator [Gemmatimonadaceae bacterium]